MPDSGAIQILNERARQRDIKNFSSNHDKGFTGGELACAAASYLLFYVCRKTKRAQEIIVTVNTMAQILWPWSSTEWKPQNDVRDLVRAGALIAAEIDRIQLQEEENHDA